MAAFEKAGDWKDAETQVKETKYLQAIDKREKENWEDAIDLFTELGDYKDAGTAQLTIRANDRFVRRVPVASRTEGRRVGQAG